MKNLKIAGIIALVAVVMLSLVGCTSTLKKMEAGATYNLGMAAKDVDVLGIVRVETKVKGDDGERITYDALLREAEKLGGNGIANVMIDKKTETFKFFFIIPVTSSVTWYGSALAIKYTNNTVPNVPASPGQLEVSPIPLPF
jgi:hypothetical protein